MPTFENAVKPSRRHDRVDVSKLSPEVRETRSNFLRDSQEYAATLITGDATPPRKFCAKEAVRYQFCRIFAGT